MNLIIAKNSWQTYSEMYTFIDIYCADIVSDIVLMLRLYQKVKQQSLLLEQGGQTLNNEFKEQVNYIVSLKMLNSTGKARFFFSYNGKEGQDCCEQEVRQALNMKQKAEQNSLRMCVLEEDRFGKLGNIQILACSWTW